MMVGGVVLSKSDDDLMRMIFMLLVEYLKFNVLFIKIFLSRKLSLWAMERLSSNSNMMALSS